MGTAEDANMMFARLAGRVSSHCNIKKFTDWKMHLQCWNRQTYQCSSLFFWYFSQL